MSKIDDVFDFADELIDEWGQQVQLIVKGSPSYDPNTGITTAQLETFDVKAVITKLDQSEIGGLYQANDVKILLDPVHHQQPAKQTMRFRGTVQTFQIFQHPLQVVVIG